MQWCLFFKLASTDSCALSFRMNSATCGGRIWDSTHLLSFSISSCCLLSLMLSDWCLNAGRVGRRRSTPHPNASGNPGSLRTTFTALSIRPSPNDLDCQLVKLDVASSFPRGHGAGHPDHSSPPDVARRALRQTARAAARREVCHHVGDARRGASLISSSASRPRLSGFLVPISRLQ